MKMFSDIIRTGSRAHESADASPSGRILRCLTTAATIALSFFVIPAFASPLPPSRFHVGPVEITGYADMNGDGRSEAIVVDRASGAIRIGFQTNTTDQLLWTRPHAGGIYHVSSVTAGRFINTSRDSIVLTTPMAGRLNFLSTLSTNMQPVVAAWHHPNIVGPLSVVAGEITGTGSFEDLLITSTLNGLPENRAQLWVGTGSTIFTGSTVIAESSTRRYDRADRVVLRTGDVQQVAFLEIASGGAALRVVSLGETGTPLRLSVSGIATNARYMLNPFHGPLGQLVTWIPNAASYDVRAITLTGTNYNHAGASTVSAPFALGQVTAVAAGTNASLLLVAADGSQAVVRNDPADTNATAVLLPPAGEQFTGATATPAGLNGFQLFSGLSASGRSTRALSYRFNAGTSGYDLIQDVALAAVTDTSGAGNVIAYAGEPFVTPGATVLNRRRARDWSVGSAIGIGYAATGEVYAGATTGLTQPAVVGLGNVPAGTTHVMVNQVHAQISLFPVDAAQGPALGTITADPVPGTYAAAVALNLRGPAGANVFFRTNPGETWTLYTQPVWLHRNTRVQAFAIGPGAARTAVFEGLYQFSVPAGELSTLGDGIPDYVKIGLGYDPILLPDRTGETNQNSTLNYLQIILDGTNVPLRNTSGTALNLHVRPHSHDGLTTSDIPTLVAGFLLTNGVPNPGNLITLYDVSGEPLDSELAYHWGFFGAGQTAAWLQRAGRGGRANITVAGTMASYALNFSPPYDPGNPFQGREMAGLVTLPAASPVGFSYVYGGGDDATEAAAWRAAAIAYYATNHPPSIGATVDTLETLLTLVFEQWVTRRFVERGLLPAYFLPTPGERNTNRLTLTSYRASEPAKPIPESGPASGLLLPTPEQLVALENYQSETDTGHQLAQTVKSLRQTIRDSNDPKMASLRNVALDIYRISARWGGHFPGAFPNPLDTLRDFLATGVMHPAYRNDWTNGLPPAIAPQLTPLTSSDYTSALAGLDVLLDLPSPRPVVTRSLVVRPDTVGLTCTRLDREGMGTTAALVHPDGSPFRFPGGFTMIPGITIQVTAYADVPDAPCADETLEPIRLGDMTFAHVTGIPAPSPGDADGNLLDDAWEMLFFGTLGNDPFADLGGGYTLLQAFLDGTDPHVPASYGAPPPASLALPEVTITSLNVTSVQVAWTFPPAYAAHLDFILQRTFDLGATWVDIPAALQHTGGGNYAYTNATGAAVDPTFWRLALRLK
ncbi:MAG TPA: hypothetical protein PKA51_00725 [Kiritimatiellia bacterium]|nr:hypothetical protein [Kiritimatiellia bacterium]